MSDSYLSRNLRRRPWLVMAIVVALVSGAAAAQPPSISETVDVRVVNFEVVVTDKAGIPVRGLSREDFELFVDGSATSIDYFSAVEDGASLMTNADLEAISDHAGAGAAAAGTDDLKPLLVIVFDGRELARGDVERAAQELIARLDDLTAVTRRVMVVRQGVSLETEQVFTSDRDLLASAIARAGTLRRSALEVGERNALIREIEHADAPSGGMSGAELLILEAQAESLMQQIKTHQRLESFALDRTTAQLRGLIRSMTGLPGRKELLYIGRGFKTQAAEPLFEMWWRKYSQLAPQLGISSVASEMGLETISRKLISVIDEANDEQVTFNAYAPGGVRSGGSNIQFSSIEAADVIDTESDRQRQFLLTLSRSTGGVGRIQASNLSPLLDEMISGFRHFYSLGFSLEGELEGPGRVEVKVKSREYRLRHLDRYRVRATERTLEDITLTALVTDIADNPLEMSVDIDTPERQSDGSYVVPILVKVPISMLALLPRANSHVGKLQLVVQAQSALGNMSPPARGEVPIEIANTELLGALGSQAGYRLRLRVAQGEQKIAVAVRDEISHTDSAINVIIETGGEK